MPLKVFPKKFVQLTLFFALLFNLNYVAASTREQTENRISVIFSNTNSQQFVSKQNLITQIKLLLLEKSKQNNFFNYSITHTQIENNFAILSVINYYTEDLKSSDDDHIHTDDELERDYFNLFFLKKNEQWQGRLDTKTPSLMLFLNQIYDNKLAETAKIIAKPQNLSSNLGSEISFQNHTGYKNYKFPWENGEAWNIEMIEIPTGIKWGWHNDQIGPALDFDPPARSNLKIYSSAPGVVEWICTQNAPLKQAGVRIRTVANGRDYGESLRYYHIDKNTLNVGYQMVKQRYYLGKIARGSNSGQSHCNLYSHNTHLHLGFPHKNFTMEGFTFRSDLNKFIKNNKCTLKAGTGEAKNCGKLSTPKKPKTPNYSNRFVDTVKFGQKLFQAHRGKNNKIYSRYSVNGKSWSDWKEHGGTTKHFVSIFIFKSKIYQTIIGTDKKLYIRGSSDGKTWSKWKSDKKGNFNIPVRSAEFNDRIYQSHVGKTKKLYLRSSSNGVNWTNWTTDNIGSFSTPVDILAFNDKLFQAHKDKDGKVYTRFSLDGKNWTSWKNMEGETGNFVTMYNFNEKLFLVRTGTDKKLYTKNTSDGENWSDWQIDETGTFLSPVVGVEFDRTAFQIHVGKNRKMYQRNSKDGINWTNWEIDNKTGF